MPWIELWRPTRIAVDAWLANADRLAALVAAARGDPWGDSWIRSGAGFLEPEALQIVRALKEILKEINDAPDLPEVVRQRLSTVVMECDSRASGLTTPLLVMYFAMQLTNARGLLDHAHAGSEAPRRSRVERAFEHLNRSLVVDSDLRGRWLTAFTEREEECEALGAVHLLLHGVFAFKANAKGGRTDLVLGGELEVTPAVVGSEALALTEWKKVPSDQEIVELAKLAEGAREQADLYRAGVLAGVEVAHTRFIVLVSKQHLAKVPDVYQPDHLGAQVVYRHVNIVIDPLTPSKAATKSLSKKAPEGI